MKSDQQAPSRRNALIGALGVGGALSLVISPQTASAGEELAGVATYANREALARVPRSQMQSLALLTEADRAGLFRWRMGDYAKRVRLDRFQALYVAAQDVSPDTGCWVREGVAAIDPQWAGACADAGTERPTDNGPILDACLQLAAVTGLGVFLPGAGGYGIASVVRLPAGVVFSGGGCGLADQTGGMHAGTTLVALADLPVMLIAEGESVLRDIALNGRDRAAIGILWGTAARATAMNVQAMRFTRHAFLLDQTQNGCFFNICFRFNASGLCLLNGARNNVFFNATGEINQLFYKGDYAQACLFTLMTDIGDPFGIGTSKTVTGGGNDLNRFVGGIFERADLAVRIIDRLPKEHNGARYGRTSFHDCELTTIVLVDTTEAKRWDGSLLLRDATIIGAAGPVERTRGAAGRLWFEGDCRFYGSPIASRGVGLTSNIATLLRTRTHDFAVDPQFPTARNASYAFEANTKIFTVESDDPMGGLIVPLNGPMATGNWDVVPETTRATRPLMRVRFVVEVGSVALYTSEDRAPFNHLIGNYNAGVHEILHACRGGEGGVLFARGAGPRTIRISNVTLELL